MEIDILLPSPHSKQREILASSAKRIVICAGRRGGKTELVASLKAIPHFMNGGRVVYGAPIAAQTDVFWETINERLRPLIDAGFLYRNKADRVIEWMNGAKPGRIRAKTAFDADTWRGDWGDLLIYDEYAYMNPNAWEVVGAPMLLDNGGEAWFISTPNRKNHFFALFQRGLDGDRWESFHFTSYDNPYLDKEALEEITSDMTESMIQQEIMAHFLDNEGAVFRNIDKCHNAPTTEPDDHKGHLIVAGIDWGKHQDYTVLSIGCADCGHELELTRFNKIDYTYQRERIARDWIRWGVSWGLAESNAMGEPNLEALQNDGLAIDGFATTATSKPKLIENLVLTLEREEFQFIDNIIAKSEMEAYEVRISETTGRPSYSAPPGVHDDTVMSRALMMQAVNSYVPAFL